MVFLPTDWRNILGDGMLMIAQICSLLNMNAPGEKETTPKPWPAGFEKMVITRILTKVPGRRRTR